MEELQEEKAEKAEKAEDRVWKVSAHAFGEEMHNSLGQTGTIKRIAPTEQIRLKNGETALRMESILTG